MGWGLGGGACVRGGACEWGTEQGGSGSLEGFKETGVEAEGSVKRTGERTKAAGVQLRRIEINEQREPGKTICRGRRLEGPADG